MKLALVEQLTLYSYRYSLGYAAIVLVPLVLLFLQLGTLTPGVNELEAASGLRSLEPGELLKNPVNWPYHLLQYASLSLLGANALALRLPSVIFALILLACLFGLFRLWHQPRIAILGTLFVAASSWFLNFARFGSPAIVAATMLVAVLLATAWFHHAKPQKIKPLILLGAVIALALYTPLVVYFVLIAVLAHLKLIWKHLQNMTTGQITVGAAALLIVLAPLIWAVIGTPGIGRELLGLPAVGLPNLGTIMLNALAAFGAIFWRSEAFPALHLGTLALLEIFTASMTALGLYHYERHYDHHRTRLLMIGFFAMLLAVGLTGAQPLLIVLLPFIYIFAATGVITMLTQWYTIFPLNPVARTVAIIPIGLVLLVTAYYHTNRYFIAWARSPETKAAFSSDAEQLRKSIERVSSDTNVLIVTDDQVRANFVLSDTTVSHTIMPPEDLVNSSLEGFDYLYIASKGEVARNLRRRLGVTPQPVASTSVKNPVAYYVFKLGGS